jgi:serine phosphatase RsbU (regulator of sigma subunit)
VHCKRQSCQLLELPGLPLGSFEGSTYEELTLELNAGDLWVFCTDGILEAIDRQGREFGADQLIDLVGHLRDQSAQTIVDSIFDAVHNFRGTARINDDMTVVALKITG